MWLLYVSRLYTCASSLSILLKLDGVRLFDRWMCMSAVVPHQLVQFYLVSGNAWLYFVLRRWPRMLLQMSCVCLCAVEWKRTTSAMYWTWNIYCWVMLALSQTETTADRARLAVSSSLCFTHIPAIEPFWQSIVIIGVCLCKNWRKKLLIVWQEYVLQWTMEVIQFRWALIWSVSTVFLNGGRKNFNQTSPVWQLWSCHTANTVRMTPYLGVQIDYKEYYRKMQN